MPDSALIELLHGQGAHADSLACVQGLSAAPAGRLVEGFPHSIYALVFHINYWIDYDLQRIHGERPHYPEHAEASWPRNSAPDKKEWSRAVIRFAELIRAMDVLAKSGAEVLRREVAALHSAHTKLASSIEAILWQTVVHNSYHIGQIAMLRRMLGVWPPEGGGDSW